MGAYRARTLSPAEFLATDRHVSSCLLCAAAIAAFTPEMAVVPLLYDGDVVPDDDHLDYDALEALVDDTAADVDREIALTHTEACATCAAALDDLQRFRRELTPSLTTAGGARGVAAVPPRHAAAAVAVATSTSWRRSLVFLATAAALVLAAFVPRLARPPARQPEPTPPGHSGGVAPSTTTPSPVEPSRPVAPSTARGPAVARRSDDDVQRGSARRVGEKAFRFVAGVWVDAAYDRLAMLPEVQAPRGGGRDALLASIPALRVYAALGDHVLVVHRGTVYRFGATSVP